MRLSGYNQTMDVENLPTLLPKDFGSLVDPGRPILSTPYSAEGPHRIQGHLHPRAQILYPTSGVYRVVTALGNWVVPPNQAIWIPSHVFHEVYSNHTVESLLLFVDEAFSTALPQKCVVINVSTLLRELFIRATDIGNEYATDGRDGHFVQFLLDELNAMEAAPLHLPMARDRRVRRIMDILLENPTDDRGLDRLARAAGASSRNFARLFRKETGMTFSEWRRQLRLMEAIDRLGDGRSVTEVALDLGYKSASAFIAMFRRSLGVTPGHYFQ
jgi:AraC-like DNA-binding protein